MANPYYDPDDGIFKCSTPGATISYSFDEDAEDEEYEEYDTSDMSSIIDLWGQYEIIYLKATKDGCTDSQVVTLNYSTYFPDDDGD